jgi:hypothetical protein
VILLPVFGFVVGFAIGRREALIVTAVAAAIGFTLVAIPHGRDLWMVGRVRLVGHGGRADRHTHRHPGSTVVPLTESTRLELAVGITLAFRNPAGVVVKRRRAVSPHGR